MAFDFTRLITDRTASDVQHWRTLRNKGFENMTDTEKAEWLTGTLKGAYNKADLNRVGECLNYLHDRLKDAGYINYLNTFKAKTNWTVASIPTEAELTYYLKCVSHIREAMTQFENTPPAPTIKDNLTYSEANNIELILIDIETLINNMLAARHYCGDVFAGEL